MGRYNSTHESKIHVYLYQEDKWPAGTLLQIWQRLVEERTPTVLWSNGTQCSINEWIRTFAPDSGRFLFLPFYHEEDEPVTLTLLIGAMWLDEIREHRARAHFVFFKNGYGEGRPLISIRKGLDLVFALFPQLTLILCQAHATNALALRLWRQIGVHVLSEEIPGWYRHVDNTVHAAKIGYILRDEWTAHIPTNQQTESEVTSAAFQ